MNFTVLQFILSALSIIIAGIFLTSATDKISEATGWGRMFVGAFLLAGATSLPEFMVDIQAIRFNVPDLAVGDLIGSSLLNLLILATLDFSFPSAFKRTIFSPKFKHHSLAGVLSMVLTAIVGIGILTRLQTSFFGVSVFSWAILIVYVYGIRYIFLHNNQAIKNESRFKKNHAPLRSSKARLLVIGFSTYIVALSVILFASPYLIQAADEIAKNSGLGHTLIGTVFVALVTSLPELVSTLAAFRMGVPDLALGNIFGSNAFNMILFVPLDFFYPKALFSAVNPIHVVSILSVIIATGIGVIGQLDQRKQRSRFSSSNSGIVIIVIVVFLSLLYWLKPN